jgi:hypothetical protein
VQLLQLLLLQHLQLLLDQHQHVQLRLIAARSSTARRG